MLFKNNSLKDLENICNEFEKIYLRKYQIFLLYGTLGVGKTQFIKTLLKNKVKDEVKSPTFNILNKYINDINIEYWHFDLYKKNNINLWEMEELGFFTLLDNIHNKCFIEWPEKLSFPIKGLKLFFTYDHNNDRIIKIMEE